MDELVTFGVLMALDTNDRQQSDASENNKTLLLFCPTIDSAQGQIVVTSRMFDLARMGFRDIAITRWCPSDKSAYAILSREGLSEAMRNTVLEDAHHLVVDAIEHLELDKHTLIDHNNN
jgi:hypothetical protein